jgi:hypothetical protein
MPKTLRRSLLKLRDLTDPEKHQGQEFYPQPPKWGAKMGNGFKPPSEGQGVKNEVVKKLKSK